MQPKEDEQLNIDIFNILFKEIKTDKKLLQEFLSDQELIKKIIETYGMQSIEDILTNEHFGILISNLSIENKNKLIDWLQPKLLLGNPPSLNQQIINSFSNEESDDWVEQYIASL